MEGNANIAATVSQAQDDDMAGLNMVEDNSAAIKKDAIDMIQDDDMVMTHNMAKASSAAMNNDTEVDAGEVDSVADSDKGIDAGEASDILTELVPKEQYEKFIVYKNKKLCKK